MTRRCLPKSLKRDGAPNRRRRPARFDQFAPRPLIGVPGMTCRPLPFRVGRAKGRLDRDSLEPQGASRLAQSGVIGSDRGEKRNRWRSWPALARVAFAAAFFLWGCHSAIPLRQQQMMLSGAMCRHANSSAHHVARTPPALTLLTLALNGFGPQSGRAQCPRWFPRCPNPVPSCSPRARGWHEKRIRFLSFLCIRRSAPSPVISRCPRHDDDGG